MKAGLLTGLAVAILALAASLFAGTPAEKPSATDITIIDDEPAPPATNPFADSTDVAGRKDAVPGCAELSDGRKLPGRIYTTRGKYLKIYNLDRQVYEYVPVPAIRQIEVTVQWERMDKEWRFKEAGNPDKIYTGREYPVRMLAWTLTLRNDHKITGHILGQPLYVSEGGRAERFILHQRDKGEMGQTLKDLVYMKRVNLGPEAYEQATKELKTNPSPKP
jgi:hypothetical protein